MRVTIAVPCHNGAPFIAKAVKSALAQRFYDENGIPEAFEVVVYNNASTDETASILAQITDKRLRVVTGENKLEIGDSFQAAFDQATTEFVTILGADDAIDTDYLTRVLPNFKDDVVMVSCHPRFIDQDGNPYYNAADPRCNIPKPGNLSREDWLKVFRITNLYFGINTYKREAVIEAGGFDVKSGWLLDWDLYTRLVMKHNIHVITEELCSLNLRKDAISNLKIEQLPKQHQYLRYLRQKNFTPTKMKVIFATACYMSQEFSEYGDSMIHTTNMLTRAEIPWDIMKINGDSYIDRAKNTIVANFLETDGTDLIMIDSDEKWHPTAISRLLQHPEEIVAAAYPFKNKWGQFAGMPLMKDVDGKQEFAGYKSLSDGSFMLEARLISGGFVRIKRSALEKYADAYPNDIYRDPCAWTEDKAERLYTVFFLCDIHDFTRYGEDAYFSRRMRDIGIKVWIDPNINITHFGVTGYPGNFHEQLQSLHQQQETNAANIQRLNEIASNVIPIKSKVA